MSKEIDDRGAEVEAETLTGCRLVVTSPPNYSVNSDYKSHDIIWKCSLSMEIIPSKHLHDHASDSPIIVRLNSSSLAQGNRRDGLGTSRTIVRASAGPQGKKNNNFFSSDH